MPGPTHVTGENVVPFLVKWRLFHSLTNCLLLPPFKPTFFFVLNSNLFWFETVAWGFDLRVNCTEFWASLKLGLRCLWFPDIQPGKRVQSSTATKSIQVTISFVACTSEQVKKNLKSYGKLTSFKPINTLRGKLVHVKEKQAKEKIKRCGLWPNLCWLRLESHTSPSNLALLEPDSTNTVDLAPIKPRTLGFMLTSKPQATVSNQKI